MSELFEVPFYHRYTSSPSPSRQLPAETRDSGSDNKAEPVVQNAYASNVATRASSPLPPIASIHQPPTPLPSPTAPSSPLAPVPPPVAPHLLTPNPAGGFDAQTPHFRVVGNVITILTSDGDPTRIPSPLKAGHHLIQYPSAVPEFQRATKFWRKKVGRYVAAVVFGQRDVHRQPKWEMAGWPAQYTFWAKEREKPNRGKDGRPRKQKHDYYLYGAPVSSFDSTLQFVYHAVWLMLGRPLNANGKSDCECAYCSKRSQEEVISPQLQRVMRGLAEREDVRAEAHVVEEDEKTDEEIDELEDDD